MHTAKIVASEGASSESSLVSCVEFAVQYLRSDILYTSTASIFDDPWRLEQVLRRTKDSKARDIEEAVRNCPEVQMIGKSIEVKLEKRDDLLLSELMSLVSALRGTSGCLLIDAGEGVRVSIGFEGIYPSDDDSEDEALSAAVSSVLFDPEPRPHCRLEGASVLRFTSVRALELHLVALVKHSTCIQHTANLALLIDTKRSDNRRIERIQHDIAALRKQLKKRAIAQQRQEIEALRDKLKADKNKHIASIAAARRREAQCSEATSTNTKTSGHDENAMPKTKTVHYNSYETRKSPHALDHSPERKPLEQHHSPPPADHLERLFPPPPTTARARESVPSDDKSRNAATELLFDENTMIHRLTAFDRPTQENTALHDGIDPTNIIECIRNVGSSLEKTKDIFTDTFHPETRRAFHSSAEHQSMIDRPYTVRHQNSTSSTVPAEYLPHKEEKDTGIAANSLTTDPIFTTGSLKHPSEIDQSTQSRTDTAADRSKEAEASNGDHSLFQRSIRTLTGNSLEVSGDREPSPVNSAQAVSSCETVNTLDKEKQDHACGQCSELADRLPTARSLEIHKDTPPSTKCSIRSDASPVVEAYDLADQYYGASDRIPTAGSLERPEDVNPATKRRLQTASSCETADLSIVKENYDASDQYLENATDFRHPVGTVDRPEDIDPLTRSSLQSSASLEKSPFERYNEKLNELYPLPTMVADPIETSLDGSRCDNRAAEDNHMSPRPNPSASTTGSLEKPNEVKKLDTMLSEARSSEAQALELDNEPSEKDLPEPAKVKSPNTERPHEKNEDTYVQAALAAYSSLLANSEEEQIDLLASVQSEDAYSFGVRLYKEIRGQTLGDEALAASISAPPPPSRQQRASTAPDNTVPPPVPVASAAPTSPALSDEPWYMSSLEQPHLVKSVEEKKQHPTISTEVRKSDTNGRVLDSASSQNIKIPERLAGVTDYALQDEKYGVGDSAKVLGSVDDLVLTAHREFVQSEAVSDLAAADEDEILASALAADGGFLREKLAAVDAKAKQRQIGKPELKLPRVTPSGWAATIDLDPLVMTDQDLSREGETESKPAYEPIDKMQRFQAMRAKRARAMEERRRLEKEHHAAMRTEGFEDETPVLAVHRQGPPRPRGAPTRKLSNKRSIHNALTQICLAGAHCAAALDDALSALESSHADNHVLLLKDDALHVFRGLFAVHRGNTTATASAGNNAAIQVEKIYGRGPSRFAEDHVQSFYKYNSATRSFQRLPARSFTFTTDAIVLTPKSSSSKTAAANMSRSKRPLPTY